MSSTIPDSDKAAINSLLKQVFSVDRYHSIQRLGGLTNHTYKVTLADESSYAIRIPGAGTERMINRTHEKISSQLACTLGIDAPVLYFGDDGSKIAVYIKHAETLSADKLCRPALIKSAADTLRTLHSCGVDTNVPFDVFDMAASYERIIRENNITLYEDYPIIKKQVTDIKCQIDRNAPVALAPCHNDPLCENWILGEDDTLYLIDWEYAGMNDPMWDLADLSIEANYSECQDQLLLTEYLNSSPSKSEFTRFQANKLYLDFLWALWGKTRVPFDGNSMEEYAFNRYTRLKRNLRSFFPTPPHFFTNQ